MSKQYSIAKFAVAGNFRVFKKQPKFFRVRRLDYTQVKRVYDFMLLIGSTQRMLYALRKDN